MRNHKIQTELLFIPELKRSLRLCQSHIRAEPQIIRDVADAYLLHGASITFPGCKTLFTVTVSYSTVFVSSTWKQYFREFQTLLKSKTFVATVCTVTYSS